MKLWVFLEHVELHLAKRLASAHALLEVSVIVRHQLSRGEIADGPKAHYQGFGARQNESATQTVNAFAVSYFANARVARGQDDQFRAPHIQTRGFKCRENSIIVAAIS